VRQHRLELHVHHDGRRGRPRSGLDVSAAAPPQSAPHPGPRCPNELSSPVQNTYLPNGDVLITDQGNQRVIEVERRSKKIVWQYGITGVAGMGFDQLNNPNSAELLVNGHVLPLRTDA
jgi:hypothetical protein